jgi:DNA-binding transcriptional MerR regulator
MIKPQAAETKDTISDIPQKLFYKIGEVSKITKLEPYVLRYWETEFAFLKPRKGKSKQRMYQKRDIEILLEIKRLLYAERFTIEGVRKRLSAKYLDSAKGVTTEAAEEGIKSQAANVVITANTVNAGNAVNQCVVEGGNTNIHQSIESVKNHLREVLAILKNDRGVAQPG